MRTLLALAVIMVFGLMWVQGDLFNFNSMISSVTKKNGATNYGAYGCHCGLGGKGTPKDATDRCCASHDCCYKRLEKRGCGTKSLSYRFKYQAGKVICEGKKTPLCFSFVSKARNLPFSFSQNPVLIIELAFIGFKVRNRTFSYKF
uniref:Phospholipase A2 n=1 Tax=Marmota marmota marmota TaxID=9994 RepID=A0A8C5ZZS8_MARMA